MAIANGTCVRFCNQPKMYNSNQNSSLHAYTVSTPTSNSPLQGRNFGLKSGAPIREEENVEMGRYSIPIQLGGMESVVSSQSLGRKWFWSNLIPADRLC